MRRFITTAAVGLAVFHLLGEYARYVHETHNERFSSIENQLDEIGARVETISRNPALIGPIVGRLDPFGGGPYSRGAITDRLHVAGREGGQQAIGEEVGRITAEMEQQDVALGLRPQP